MTESKLKYAIKSALKTGYVRLYMRMLKWDFDI